MKHLSGIDSLFLHMEQGNQYMHVAGLGIYDPSTAPGGKVRFKQVLRFFANRLTQSKVFRRRLVQPPFGIDRPYWMEDGEIDIEYHVRHIALPHPGDWRQLMIQVARIHSRPLDMTKPLWEAYIIEGLNNIPGVSPGSFAMYTKFHHAAIDGEAGTELIRAIHSLTPLSDEEEGEGVRTIIADREPTLIELYARALGNRAKQFADASRLAVDIGQLAMHAGSDLLASGKLAEYTQKLLPVGKAGQLPALPAPNKDVASFKVRTRFDNDVSAHRVVDAVGFSLADCKRIRQHVPEVTINDIFLAATAGGLRKYLEAKGELPARSLNAMMPVSARTSKGLDGGNQIGMTALPLRTDIADAMERLLAVRRGSGKTKALNQKLGKDLPMKVLEVLPAQVSEWMLRMSIMSMCNVTVSNVRGPDVPLYMAGAHLQLFLPVSIAFTGIGLNVTGFSYNGTLWVCFVSCRQMIPDPSQFSQCLNEAFEETVKAALRQPAVVGPKVAPDRAPAKPAATKPMRTKRQIADNEPVAKRKRPRAAAAAKQ